MEGMDNTLVQPASFLIMLYGGILLGMTGCLLCALRARFPAKRFCMFCDALLAGSFLIISAVSFLLATRGELRLYGFAALALGAHLAYVSFGALLKRALSCLQKQNDSNALHRNPKYSRSRA